VIVEVKRGRHVQKVTYEDFEERIRNGEITAETWVRFEVVTGDEFKPAGELELFATLADPNRMEFRRNLTEVGIPIMTAILVGFQLRVYMWSWVDGVDGWLQEEFTNWTPAILEQGEVIRLLSYGLLHVTFTHLLFNLCFLAYTGYHLERAAGRANLVIIYFTSVFVGGVLSMVMAPDRPSLGASGGDFGLLAAAVVLGWKHGDSIPNSARKFFGWALVPYIGFSIMSGLEAQNVDNWSHLGGLVGGATMMTLLEPDALTHRMRRNRRIRWISVAVVLLSSLAIAGIGTRIVPLTRTSARGWSVDRPVYWRPGWTFTGDRGWFSPTLNATMAAVTTVHPRPLTADEAANNLIERIGSGGKDLEISNQSQLEVNGWDARRFSVRFVLNGDEQVVTALVMARGVNEHRVQFQSVADTVGRYAPLVERVFNSAHVSELDEVSKARERATAHPRSWSPAVELGAALYRSGKPEEALAAYRQALEIAPDQPRAIVGLLRVYADYGVPGGEEVAREAVKKTPDVIGVVVAAADVLNAQGFSDESKTMLDDAWIILPGDRGLRRARLRYGLSVELTDPSSDLSPDAQ